MRRAPGRRRDRRARRRVRATTTRPPTSRAWMVPSARWSRPTERSWPSRGRAAPSSKWTTRSASRTSTAPATRPAAPPSGESLSASSVVFSPDGSKVAFDGTADMLRALDSDVRVLDVESGDVVTVADDGVRRSDRTAGRPASVGRRRSSWRSSASSAWAPTSPRGPQVVFAELDGDADVVDAAGIGPRDVGGGRSAGVLGDRYVLAVGGDPADWWPSTTTGRSRPRRLDGPAGRSADQPPRGSGRGRGRRRRSGAAARPARRRPALTWWRPRRRSRRLRPPSHRTAASSPRHRHRRRSAGPASRCGTRRWATRRHLEPVDGVPTLSAVSGVVWTADDRIVMWSAEGWQAVDIRWSATVRRRSW